MPRSLAGALLTAEDNLRDLERRLESFLTSIFKGGWRGWAFVRGAPNALGIEIYEAIGHPVPARALHLAGFAEVRIHDHAADRQLLTCTCLVYEAPRLG